MKTRLKSVHEETASDGRYIFGVILNDNDEGFKESFTFIFEHARNMYTFFDTMMDLFDFRLYGEDKKKRAYMAEDEFDTYLDADEFEGKFADILKWV